jgi:hypothetical protein
MELFLLFFSPGLVTLPLNYFILFIVFSSPLTDLFFLSFVNFGFSMNYAETFDRNY